MAIRPLDWLRTKARSLSRRRNNDWLTEPTETAIEKRHHIMSQSDRNRSRPMIGKLFFFYYDPKWKHKLPIHDKFPLVIPIEYYNDGFLGLNLHYLDNNTRRALLSELNNYLTNSKLDETTRIRISYQLVKGLSTLRMANPAIKRYLYTHVHSQFVEIHADEWQYAIELPVAVWIRNPRA